MRKSTAAILALAALTVGAAACGSEPDSDSSAPAGAPPTTATGDAATPKTPDATTTTTKPRVKIKAQADCQTYAAFSIGYSAVAFANPEQREDVITKFQPLVEALKAETPQFAGEIDTINFLATKSANVGLTPEEQEQLRGAFAPITEWNTTTCLIQPGEEG